MNLRIEQTVGDLVRSHREIHRELSTAGVLPGVVLVIVTIVAIASEFSVGNLPSGGTHIRVLGPLSTVCVLACLAIASYSLVVSRNANKYEHQVVRDSDLAFAELSDFGVRYGIIGVWDRSYAWQMVSRVEFEFNRVILSLPRRQVMIWLEGLA